MVLRLGLRDRLVGGVGGTSPVSWTRASTEVHRSFRAATGFKVKMSISSPFGMRPSSADGDESDCLMPGSREGFGVAG